MLFFRLRDNFLWVNIDVIFILYSLDLINWIVSQKCTFLELFLTSVFEIVSNAESVIKKFNLLIYLVMSNVFKVFCLTNVFFLFSSDFCNFSLKLRR